MNAIKDESFNKVQIYLYKKLTTQQAQTRMKSVLQLLQMDHKHMQHELCHPRRQASFDNDAIHKKIDQIRQKKQQLRVQADRKRHQLQNKRQRFQQFPLQQILQQSIEPLDESTSMMVKQKMKFIEEKVYIGTKNNINSQYISRVVESNDAKPALKYQLSLFMQDLIGNLEGDIVAGEYDIFSKKDIIVPKHQQQGQYEGGATKLINIKKVQLSQKIQELKDQLVKTQLEQQKLSPSLNKRKSISVRAASANESIISNSLNIDEYSIKSERTRQAQQFIKKLQKQQQEQRKQRKRREQQLHKSEVKSQQQKRQFQQHIKKQRHQKLKVKYQNERKQKQVYFDKITNTKVQYQKFLSQYRKRIPLYKQKDINFQKQQDKLQKEKVSSVLSQIKQSKRSIDINELKQHENKYKLIRQEFEKQKLASLKHRQKQIHLRQKQDKLYFKGRYHSMIKQEEQKQPQDPIVKREQLLKKMKEYGQKVKKQHVPSIDQNKQKQLDQLIQKINRNKPTVEGKDFNQVGNSYLRDLHKLVGEMRKKGKIKLQLPEEIKPKYKNYLQDLKKTRKYQTISYDMMSEGQLQKQANRIDQKVMKKQKVLALTNQMDIYKQMKQINQLDLELLKSAQIKAKLVQKYDPLSDHNSDDSDY